MTGFSIGIMIGLFAGVWAVYFARKWIWGFDPDEEARRRGLRR